MLGRVFLLCLILATAGCFDAGGIVGQGTKSGTEQLTVDCSGGQGNVLAGIQGTGRVSVTVKDGAGKQVFQKEFDGSGQEGTNHPVQGTAGTWTLTATFSGSSSSFGMGGFNGQWSINLAC